MHVLYTKKPRIHKHFCTEPWGSAHCFGQGLPAGIWAPLAQRRAHPANILACLVPYGLNHHSCSQLTKQVRRIQTLGRQWRHSVFIRRRVQWLKYSNTTNIVSKQLRWNEYVLCVCVCHSILTHMVECRYSVITFNIGVKCHDLYVSHSSYVNTEWRRTYISSSQRLSHPRCTLQLLTTVSISSR